jgi:hypothetical protein
MDVFRCRILVEWNGTARMTETIPRVSRNGDRIKADFSQNAPAEIEFIVIVSDLEQVGCHWHQNEKMLEVPVRGYVATSKRVNRKECGP